MFVELRHIIQWLHNPRNARDPRISFFAALKRASSVDPLSLKLVKKDDVLIIEGKYTFPEINLAALKKQKLESKSKTKNFKLEFKDWEKETVKIKIPVPSLFQISLDDAFIYWQFYVILTDKNKMKKFLALIKE